jgi:disease resistance protein RPM1
VLAQFYDNLPDYDHRLFLLYLSIFPRGHHIKSKTLVRRLMAEGLVDEGCCKCFDHLVDHCVIKPVQISNNLLVAKSYHVHDVMLEYIIQKSVDKNLVTLIQGHEPLLTASTGDSVRRLSVQSSSEQRFDELEDRSAALRSLTIFKSEPFDLQSCKLLRLLDLEGCTELDKTFLNGLTELLLLRYLSLRKTGIDELPEKMEKLQRLEMLDIRETKVESLPIKVIMLPKLAYLFGKFQLSDVSNIKERNLLSDFMKKKSVLHTLSGYVANGRQGPEHVILLGRKLKKVKVWCEETCRSQMRRQRRTKTKQGTGCDNINFIGLLKKRFTSLESVSIISSRDCNDFLGSLEGSCAISSIKLRGNLDCLPKSDKLRELGRIKKLQLFSTGLSIQDFSALQYLRGLEYLKLVDNSHTFYSGIFIVEENGFESLKSLYIEAINVPRMQFKEGAMKSLTSLHLHCPSFSPKQPQSETVEGISHHTNLSEVILHSSMPKDWETVADGHPNRPCVRKQ